MQLKWELNSRMPHPDVLDKSRKAHRSLVALAVRRLALSGPSSRILAMIFDPKCEADILRLVDEYPLAWLVSAGASCFGASPLPLLAETDPGGRIASLVGHVAIAHPQVTQQRASPIATVLFAGPDGYISPELVSKPDWAPTWNYASARFSFRAHVRAVHGRFKLGQDESPRTLSDILSGLKDASLTRWMKDFNGPLLTYAPKEST